MKRLWLVGLLSLSCNRGPEREFVAKRPSQPDVHFFASTASGDGPCTYFYSQAGYNVGRCCLCEVFPLELGAKPSSEAPK